MVAYGADVGELRSLATLFRAKADLLDDDVRAIGMRLHGSPWSGVDAEGFRHLWSSQTSVSLRAVAGGLRAAAETLDRNATEQDHASRAEGGAPSTGVSSQRAAHVDLGQYLRYMGQSIMSLDKPLDLSGALGIITMFDSLGELGGAPNANALLPTLGGIRGMSWLHDAIEGIPGYGAVTGALGWAMLGRDGIDALMIASDERVSLGHKVKSVVAFAGSAAQQAPPTTPLYWLGTATKSTLVAVDSVVAAVEAGPPPTGDELWRYVAGKARSDNPLVATHEVISGLAPDIIRPITQVLGEVF